MTRSYFVGVDVGTKSVRAGLVCSTGVVLTEELPITVLNLKPDFYEQNSKEIWSAVGNVVKKVVSSIPDKTQIKGIGFDATCSLVLLDENFHGVPTCPDGKKDFDVIMWMDHRAMEQADLVNKKHFRVHDYVGGKISLEMQMPKLLWLKAHHPEGWKACRHFFDLPDFLTFKATGTTKRSLCSLTCKWNYLSDGNSHGWDEDFLCGIGLEDLCKDNYSMIGSEALYPGERCGTLTTLAADHLGLAPGTAVGTSILDAHAGGLALVSTQAKSLQDFIGKLALICGTSTCHMSVSKGPVFVPGVWGPYWSAMVPNLWLSEGGQSATGSLVDHVIFGHPAAKDCPANTNIYKWLEGILQDLREKKDLKNISFLTKSLHVYPDFHGNRSPLADPNMKGMISGLTLDSGVESLALLFLATVQSVAYGTRDIIEQLVRSGQEVNALVMCGGLSKSRLFIQIHADALGKPIVIPEVKESVLFGASMLGAAASGSFGKVGDLTQVALSMGGGATVFGADAQMAEFHCKKFDVFKKMQRDVCSYEEFMIR